MNLWAFIDYNQIDIVIIVTQWHILLPWHFGEHLSKQSSALLWPYWLPWAQVDRGRILPGISTEILKWSAKYRWKWNIFILPHPYDLESVRHQLPSSGTPEILYSQYYSGGISELFIYKKKWFNTKKYTIVKGPWLVGPLLLKPETCTVTKKYPNWMFR